MKTEEQVLQLFADENPIPRSALELDESAGLTDHLAAPPERSSKVIEMDENDLEQSRKRSTIPWLVAAFLVVVAGTVGLIALTNGEDEGPVADRSVPPTEASNSTTAAPTPTTQATESAGVTKGTVMMEFNDTVLEASFEECSLEPLHNEESFRAGGLRLDAAAPDGTEWQVSAMLNFREPGDFQFEAVGPDGQPNLLAWPDQPGTTIESEITDASAVFSTQFFDRAEDIETQAADIPVEVTITCG